MKCKICGKPLREYEDPLFLVLCKRCYLKEIEKHEKNKLSERKK